MDDSFTSRLVRMVHELGLPAPELVGERVRVTVPIVETEGPDAPVTEVFVRHCGEMHGKEVLEFASAGLRLPDDDTAKMPLLILALQRNADVMLGHWGLDESEDGSTLRVFHAQIAETMDLPELRGALLGVADEYATLAEAFEDVVFKQP